MKTKEIVRIGLMAALISVISPLSVPIGSVPISLATFVIMLSSALFGCKVGTLSTIIYILLGCIGIPVFAGYTAGISIVAGVTGGYIIGYVALAFFTGFMSDLVRNKEGIKYYSLMFTGMITGTIVLYFIGTVYFEFLTQMPLKSAMMACIIPFIPGDILKMIAVLILQSRLKKISYLKS